MSVPPQAVVFAIFVGFAAWEAWRGGFFRKTDAVRDDHLADGLSYILTGAVVVPLVLFAADRLAALALPGSRDALADLPWWAGVALFLVFDDMAQYWWHRGAHTLPWLYRLHRAHHEGGYMSVRVAYRNNVFYYALMPSFWFSGVLLYLGFGWVYAGYLIVKQLVVLGAHSDVRWDAPLYRHAWLHPIAWVVERTISTPSTHAMHHGKYKDDGVTFYKGNYSNLLFLWDLLFGTAKITRRYPGRYGTEGLGAIDWREQLFWPLARPGRLP